MAVFLMSRKTISMKKFPWGKEHCKGLDLHSMLKDKQFEIIYKELVKRSYEEQYRDEHSYMGYEIFIENEVKTWYEDIFVKRPEKYTVTERSHSYIEERPGDHDLNLSVIYMPKRIQVEEYAGYVRYIELYHGFDTSILAYEGHSDNTGATFDDQFNFTASETIPLVLIGGM
jgi:hypothetical protein